jgi:heat-inducible transcriptional repressor
MRSAVAASILASEATELLTPVLESKRNQEILAAIVRAYVQSGEPISSRSIARHTAEPLSPATVRNVMADLEDAGYLYQPYTSAGRVPTESAYRFFVEEVAAQATPRPEDREWIRKELDEAKTPEALMERASHVLSAMSGGLGIIVAPPLARTVVEHLRFLLLPDGRVLVVLIAKGGLTRDKAFRPERAFPQEELDQIADHINRHYSGWTLESIRVDLRVRLERDKERYGQLLRAALELCDPSVVGEDRGRRLYVEGAATVATSLGLPDTESLRELLGTIEERGKLVDLLSIFLDAPEALHVELGVKQMAAAGKHLALVSAPYMSDEHVQGLVNILGPMRMEYERAITAVMLMAQLLAENMEGS